MRAVISPGKLNGTVKAPPSKSYAHRMLIGAALANGESCLEGIVSSEDMLATLDCISALGAGVKRQEDQVLIRGICGKAPSRDPSDPLPVFPCRESGSTLRFFIPVSLALCGGGIFTGSKRLIERGIGVYEELFRDKPVTVEKEEEAIRIRGGLSAGCYTLEGDVSSQFVTGMLFALSLLKEDSILKVLPPVESRAYIDVTIDCLKQYGVTVQEKDADVFAIKGGQNYLAGNHRIEGDWSNAAFLYAFQTVGSSLDIQGLNEESIQGDKACVGFLDQIKEGDGRGPIDISDTPDLGPVLFAVSAALNGGAFTGTKRLRIKESDRAEAMAQELKKFGITCRIGDNDAEVFPDDLQKPDVPLNGHNDHRIVMALSILASLTGGVIEGAEAVRKSWPDYFEQMKKIGLKAELSD